MECEIDKIITLLPRDLKGSDGRVYTVANGLDEVIRRTKSMFRTLSLDIEHERRSQVGFINTETLTVEDNQIIGRATYIKGFDDTRFKGLSPVLLVDESFDIKALSALSLTDEPNFKMLSYKGIEMENQLKELQGQIAKLTETNDKLMGELVEQRNSARASKIEEMVSVDANLGMFKTELLSKGDESFDTTYKTVMGSKKKLIEQDNTRLSATDDVAKNILSQLGL